MNTTKDIISEIVALELAMFLAVPSDGQGNCQDYPESFTLHRKAQFCIWSEETLSSYLQDLQQAQKNGRNLMTIKYACIQGLIPFKNDSAVIDKIIKIKVDWQAEMIKKFPGFMARARPLDAKETKNELVSFRDYARGELETYSQKTLELLYLDCQQMVSRNINGSEAIYTQLVQSFNMLNPNKPFVVS